MIIPTSNTLVYKVVFIGDSGVGKTSIVQRINTSKFDGTFDSTIGASAISQEVDTPDGKITLNIWDTAGQERYRSLISTYARYSNAAVICFDVTSYKSFQSLSSWVDTLKNICDANCRFIIVGNKADLQCNVTESTLSGWCEEYDYRFVITSAKTGLGIDELKNIIVEEVLLSHQEEHDSLRVVNPKPTDASGSSCC